MKTVRRQERQQRGKRLRKDRKGGGKEEGGREEGAKREVRGLCMYRADQAEAECPPETSRHIPVVDGTSRSTSKPRLL
eukprot:1532198-Rhodomonas_salina.1